MDAQQVRQFRERWQAVAAIELEEQRATSVEQRWRQLNTIVRLAVGLHMLPKSESDEDSVRQRWAELKRNY